MLLKLVFTLIKTPKSVQLNCIGLFTIPAVKAVFQNSHEKWSTEDIGKYLWGFLTQHQRAQHCCAQPVLSDIDPSEEDGHRDQSRDPCEHAQMQIPRHWGSGHISLQAYSSKKKKHQFLIFKIMRKHF